MTALIIFVMFFAACTIGALVRLNRVSEALHETRRIADHADERCDAYARRITQLELDVSSLSRRTIGLMMVGGNDG